MYEDLRLILILTYNIVVFIENAIESIINQTYHYLSDKNVGKYKKILNLNTERNKIWLVLSQYWC